MKIIVCVKQVPNTNEIKINPETGTLIRDGVESILNHDDANALEQALQIKDAQPDTEVTVLTMGPPQAKEMLQECIAMGVDEAVLLSDRALGGSDTWATSNALAAGIKKIGDFDLIFAGRQAIDGDTAQVGPQIAEKLGIPQVTYAEDILEVKNGKVTVKRRLEHGVETVVAPLPCVVTVNGSAAECRPRNAKRLMKYKYAASPSEAASLSETAAARLAANPELNIAEWGAAYVEADPEQIGLAGSPTKVKTVENVVFTAKESRRLDNNDEQIETLIKELIANHTIG